jgi:uncharacterized protein (DUF58 family)
VIRSASVEAAERAAAEPALLPPAVLERLGGLSIIHRYVVEGFMAGIHRSAYRGAGDEFSRHRSYQQGDDVRRVDWKLYGRTDRLFVREYREDANLQSYLLLDATLSMGYADGAGISKLRYASFVAAALAHLMVAVGDAVGLASFGEGAQLHLPPRNRRGSVHEMLLGLERLRPEGSSGAAAGLDRAGEALRRRGRVILISDLLEPDDGEALLAAVARLRGRGDEVIVIRPLTPQETGAAPLAAGLYFDPERPEREIPASPEVARAFAAGVTAYYDRMHDRLRERGAEYVALTTAEPVEHALSAWLRARGR